MDQALRPAPVFTPARRRQALAAIGLGTALSLLGDAALYAVLPSHTAEAGVALASVLPSQIGSSRSSQTRARREPFSLP